MSDNTASQNLITAADRATKTVTAVIINLQKTTAELANQSIVFETLGADIQQKESQLTHLNSHFDNEFRTKTAELNIRVLENDQTVLHALLSKHGLARITSLELNTLNTNLSKATADNAEAIQSAVGAALSNAKSAHASELATVRNTHAVETATLKAEASSKDERIAFLTGEIASLRNQIDAERNTRLAIAQADAGRQGVVVNAGKQ